jgi:hypothetical protein
MKKTAWLAIAFVLVSAVYAFAGNGHRRGSGFNEGILEMSDYPILFEESSSDPAAPLSSEIQLYAKDKAGTTTLYTQDASGTVKEIADSGDLSSYLTSATAASTYQPIGSYLTSSDLTPYALLDGTNQPFTGNISFGDNLGINLGTGTDYSIKFDAANAVHSLTSGSLIFNKNSTARKVNLDDLKIFGVILN